MESAGSRTLKVMRDGYSGSWVRQFRHQVPAKCFMKQTQQLIKKAVEHVHPLMTDPDDVCGGSTATAPLTTCCISCTCYIHRTRTSIGGRHDIQHAECAKSTTLKIAHLPKPDRLSDRRPYARSRPLQTRVPESAPHAYAYASCRVLALCSHRTYLQRLNASTACCDLLVLSQNIVHGNPLLRSKPRSQLAPAALDTPPQTTNSDRP